MPSRARDGSTAEMRRMVTTSGVERWGQKRRDIDAVLRKNPDLVNYWVGLGSRRRLEDPDFVRRLDALDRELAVSHPGSSA